MKDARSNTYVLVMKKPYKVLVCLVTLVAFSVNILSYDLAWAARETAGLPSVGSESAGGPGSPTKELRVETFMLPAYLGTVQYANAADHGTVGTVVHIQDAHCNYAAQKKISEILDYLHSEYGIRTVNLEGGSKEYDLSVFTGIGDLAVRQKVSDHFVSEGTVTGAEYYAANNPDNVKLWGIEDPKLYIENLNVYRGSLVHKEEVDKDLKALAHILGNLKTHIYSTPLLEFDETYMKYKSNDLPFREYLDYLVKNAKQVGIAIGSFTNIYLLNQALDAESALDFKQANNERDALIDTLQKKLSKKSMEEMIVKTVEFKGDRLSHKEFYTYLTEKAKAVGLDLAGYPVLQKYIVYISLYEAIDKAKIMAELEIMEDGIRNALCENDDQRELASLSKNLALLRNFFNVSLTRGDYAYYKRDADAFAMSRYMNFINRMAPLYKISARPSADIGNVDEYRRQMAQFYEYSFMRDNAFVKNLKFDDEGREASAKPRHKATVVITGGFHTENLCDLLKEKGISYISLLPNFKSVDGYESKYFSLLQGKEDPLEKQIMAILPSALAVASFLNVIGTLTRGARAQTAFNLNVRWMTALASGKSGILIRHGAKELAIGVDGTTVPVNTPGLEVVTVTELAPSLQLPGVQAPAGLAPAARPMGIVSFGIAMVAGYMDKSLFLQTKKPLIEMARQGIVPEGFKEMTVTVDGREIRFAINAKLLTRYPNAEALQKLITKSIDIRGPPYKDRLVNNLSKKKLILIDSVEMSPALYGDCEDDGYVYINERAPQDLDAIGVSHELMHEAGILSGTADDEKLLAKEDARFIIAQGLVDTVRALRGVELVPALERVLNAPLGGVKPYVAMPTELTVGRQVMLSRAIADARAVVAQAHADGRINAEERAIEDGRLTLLETLLNSNNIVSFRGFARSESEYAWVYRDASGRLVLADEYFKDGTPLNRHAAEAILFAAHTMFAKEGEFDAEPIIDAYDSVRRLYGGDTGLETSIRSYVYRITSVARMRRVLVGGALVSAASLVLAILLVPSMGMWASLIAPIGYFLVGAVIFFRDILYPDIRASGTADDSFSTSLRKFIGSDLLGGYVFGALPLSVVFWGLYFFRSSFLDIPDGLKQLRGRPDFAPAPGYTHARMDGNMYASLTDKFEKSVGTIKSVVGRFFAGTRAPVSVSDNEDTRLAGDQIVIDVDDGPASEPTSFGRRLAQDLQRHFSTDPAFAADILVQPMTGYYDGESHSLLKTFFSHMPLGFLGIPYFGRKDQFRFLISDRTGVRIGEILVRFNYPERASEPIKTETRKARLLFKKTGLTMDRKPIHTFNIFTKGFSPVSILRLIKRYGTLKDLLFHIVLLDQQYPVLKDDGSLNNANIKRIAKTLGVPMRNLSYEYMADLVLVARRVMQKVVEDGSSIESLIEDPRIELKPTNTAIYTEALKQVREKLGPYEQDRPLDEAVDNASIRRLKLLRDRFNGLLGTSEEELNREFLYHTPFYFLDFTMIRAVTAEPFAAEVNEFRKLAAILETGYLRSMDFEQDTRPGASIERMPPRESFFEIFKQVFKWTWRYNRKVIISFMFGLTTFVAYNIAVFLCGLYIPAGLNAAIVIGGDCFLAYGLNMLIHEHSMYLQLISDKSSRFMRGRVGAEPKMGYLTGTMLPLRPFYFEFEGVPTAAIDSEDALKLNFVFKGTGRLKRVIVKDDFLETEWFKRLKEEHFAPGKPYADAQIVSVTDFEREQQMLHQTRKTIEKTWRDTADQKSTGQFLRTLEDAIQKHATQRVDLDRQRFTSGLMKLLYQANQPTLHMLEDGAIIGGNYGVRDVENRKTRKEGITEPGLIYVSRGELQLVDDNDAPVLGEDGKAVTVGPGAFIDERTDGLWRVVSEASVLRLDIQAMDRIAPEVVEAIRGIPSAVAPQVAAPAAVSGAALTLPATKYFPGTENILRSIFGRMGWDRSANWAKQVLISLFESLPSLLFNAFINWHGGTAAEKLQRQKGLYGFIYPAMVIAAGTAGFIFFNDPNFWKAVLSSVFVVNVISHTAYNIWASRAGRAQLTLGAAAPGAATTAIEKIAIDPEKELKQTKDEELINYILSIDPYNWDFNYNAANPSAYYETILSFAVHADKISRLIFSDVDAKTFEAKYPPGTGTGMWRLGRRDEQKTTTLKTAIGPNGEEVVIKSRSFRDRFGSATPEGLQEYSDELSQIPSAQLREDHYETLRQDSLMLWYACREYLIMEKLKEKGEIAITESIEAIAVRTDRQGATFYIVEKYAQGKTLETLIREGHKFSLLEIKQIGQKLLDILAKLWDAGFMHLDLHPGNIYINYDKGVPNVVVGDFGVSVYDPERKGADTTTWRGTPDYSPDEAITGVSYRRKDLYAVGRILYDLLFKTVPAADPGGRLGYVEGWEIGTVSDMDFLDGRDVMLEEGRMVREGKEADVEKYIQKLKWTPSSDKKSGKTKFDAYMNLYNFTNKRLQIMGKLLLLDQNEFLSIVRRLLSGGAKDALVDPRTALEEMRNVSIGTSQDMIDMLRAGIAPVAPDEFMGIKVGPGAAPAGTVLPTLSGSGITRAYFAILHEIWHAVGYIMVHPTVLVSWSRLKEAFKGINIKEGTYTMPEGEASWRVSVIARAGPVGTGIFGLASAGASAYFLMQLFLGHDPVLSGILAVITVFLASTALYDSLYNIFTVNPLSDWSQAAMARSEGAPTKEAKVLYTQPAAAPVLGDRTAKEKSIAEKVKEMFARSKEETPDGVKQVTQLNRPYVSPDYLKDRMRYLQELGHIVIRDLSLPRFGEPRRIGNDVFETVLIRDTNKNMFIAVLKNGKVEEVALQRFQLTYEFTVVDDPDIREILQKKIFERFVSQDGSVRTTSFSLKGDAKVMAGLVTEDEIREAQGTIVDDPLLSHLFGFIYDEYPGVRLRGFINVEIPSDYAGYYKPRTQQIAKELDGSFNGELYAHELTHHIYDKLETAFAAKKRGEATNRDEVLAGLFEKIQSHFMEETHGELFRYLRESKLYGKRVANDPVYLRDEALAFITGWIFDRKVVEPHSGYRMTFRDVRLLVELGILPKAIYGNEALFRDVDENMPLPEMFHEIAEMLAKVGSISQALKDEGLLKAITGEVAKGAGRLTSLIQWLVMTGHYSDAEALLNHIEKDASCEYKGKAEEVLLGYFTLYHAWPKIDVRRRAAAYDNLVKQMQVEDSVDPFITLFSQKSLKKEELRQYFKERATLPELKQAFSYLLAVLFSELDKEEARKSLFSGNERIVVLYRALSMIYYILEMDEVAQKFSTLAKQAEDILEYSGKNAWARFLLADDRIPDDGKRDRLRAAMEGEEYKVDKAAFDTLFLPQDSESAKKLDLEAKAFMDDHKALMKQMQLQPLAVEWKDVVFKKDPFILAKDQSFIQAKLNEMYKAKAPAGWIAEIKRPDDIKPLHDSIRMIFEAKQPTISDYYKPVGFITPLLQVPRIMMRSLSLILPKGFAKRNPYGLTGMVVFIAMTTTAFAMQWFGIMSPDVVISIVHNATILALALTALAWMYRAYLHAINDGNLRADAYRDASAAALRMRVFSQFAPERAAVNEADAQAMADREVAVVKDIREVDDGDFAALINQMAGRNAVISKDFIFNPENNTVYIKTMSGTLSTILPFTKNAQYVNNAFYNPANGVLYIKDTAARTRGVGFALVVGHERGKKVFADTRFLARIFGRRVAEVIGDAYEIWALLTYRFGARDTMRPIGREGSALLTLAIAPIMLVSTTTSAPIECILVLASLPYIFRDAISNIVAGISQRLAAFRSAFTRIMEALYPAALTDQEFLSILIRGVEIELGVDRERESPANRELFRQMVGGIPALLTRLTDNGRINAGDVLTADQMNILRRAIDNGLLDRASPIVRMIQPSAATPPAAAGLMGKYDVIGQAAYDENTGLITMTVKNIETDDPEETISLKANRITAGDASKLLAGMLTATTNPVARRILEWFISSCRAGLVLVIEDNEYGIHGIGQQGLVAVTESALTNPVALFHEAGEAAIKDKESKVTFEQVKGQLGDENTAWYDAHMAKSGRKAMADHYALRALQKELYPDLDAKLTAGIKAVPGAARGLDMTLKTVGSIEGVLESRFGSSPKELAIIDWDTGAAQFFRNFLSMLTRKFNNAKITARAVELAYEGEEWVEEARKNIDEANKDLEGKGTAVFNLIPAERSALPDGGTVQKYLDAGEPRVEASSQDIVVLNNVSVLDGAREKLTGRIHEILKPNGLVIITFDRRDVDVDPNGVASDSLGNMKSVLEKLAESGFNYSQPLAIPSDYADLNKGSDFGYNVMLLAWKQGSQSPLIEGAQPSTLLPAAPSTRPPAAASLRAGAPDAASIRFTAEDVPAIDELDRMLKALLDALGPSPQPGVINGLMTQIIITVQQNAQSQGKNGRLFSLYRSFIYGRGIAPEYNTDLAARFMAYEFDSNPEELMQSLGTGIKILAIVRANALSGQAIPIIAGEQVFDAAKILGEKAVPAVAPVVSGTSLEIEAVKRLTDEVKAKIADFKKEFERREGRGADVGAAYSEILDYAITKLADHLGMNEDFTILTMGSLARRAVPYGSDVDLILLVDDQPTEAKLEALRAKAKRFVELLTVEIVPSLTGADFLIYPKDHVKNGIACVTRSELEARYNALGREDEDDYAPLLSLITRRYITGKDPQGVKAFLDGLIEKTGAMEKLESGRLMAYFIRMLVVRSVGIADDEIYSYNIKLGSGGSRAIDALCWTLQGRLGIADANVDWQEKGAFKRLLNVFVEKGAMSVAQAENLMKARAFLISLRVATNLIREKERPVPFGEYPSGDVLGREIMPEVAIKLGMDEATLVSEVRKNVETVENIVREIATAEDAFNAIIESERETPEKMRNAEGGIGGIEYLNLMYGRRARISTMLKRVFEREAARLNDEMRSGRVTEKEFGRRRALIIDRIVSAIADSLGLGTDEVMVIARGDYAEQNLTEKSSLDFTVLFLRDKVPDSDALSLILENATGIKINPVFAEADNLTEKLAMELKRLQDEGVATRVVFGAPAAVRALAAPGITPDLAEKLKALPSRDAAAIIRLVSADFANMNEDAQVKAMDLAKLGEAARQWLRQFIEGLSKRPPAAYDRKMYKKGVYRTVVSVSEGRVSIAEYDEKGIIPGTQRFVEAGKTESVIMAVGKAEVTLNLGGKSTAQYLPGIYRTQVSVSEGVVSVAAHNEDGRVVGNEIVLNLKQSATVTVTINAPAAPVPTGKTAVLHPTLAQNPALVNLLNDDRISGIKFVAGEKPGRAGKAEISFTDQIPPLKVEVFASEIGLQKAIDEHVNKTSEMKENLSDIAKDLVAYLIRYTSMTASDMTDPVVRAQLVQLATVIRDVKWANRGARNGEIAAELKNMFPLPMPEELKEKKSDEELANILAGMGAKYHYRAVIAKTEVPDIIAISEQPLINGQIEERVDANTQALVTPDNRDEIVRVVSLVRKGQNASSFNFIRRILNKIGYGKGRSGQLADMSGEFLVTVEADKATPESFIKAIEEASFGITKSSDGRVVAYVPEKFLDEVKAKFLPLDYITIVPDAYTDIKEDGQHGEKYYPDLMARIAFARNLAFFIRTKNDQALRAMKALLNAISLNGEGFLIIKDDGTFGGFNGLLRIKPIDYKGIDKWRTMQEAVAASA